MARLGGQVGKSALGVLCSLVLVNCDGCAPRVEDGDGTLDLGGQPSDGHSSGGRGSGGADGTDGTGGQIGTTGGSGGTSGGGTSGGGTSGGGTSGGGTGGGSGGSVSFCGADDPECCTPSTSYCESGWACQSFVGPECTTPLVCHEECAFGCLKGVCLPDPDGMGGMGGMGGTGD